MGFNSNIPSLANQVVTSINLPTIDKKELFEERLEKILQNISDIINTKEAAVYDLKENLSFKQYFTTGTPYTYRNVYRKAFDLVDLNGGNIAAAATVTTPHNITGLDDAILIYVSCVSTTNEYFTAVYPDIHLTATDVSFTNPNAAAVSSAIAVAEYTKA